MRLLSVGLVLVGLAGCSARHGDPLGPDWLPQEPQPTWGRVWRISPDGPVRARSIDHVADQIVGVATFRNCLRAARAAEAVVTLRWTILHDGSVQNVVLVGTTQPDPDLTDCLSTALGQTRFVPAQTDNAVEWTFVHRAKRGPIAMPQGGSGSPDTATATGPQGRPGPSIAKEWFRACYDAGRAVDPGLNGHVAFRYLIDLAGKVLTVRDEGSNISDPEVVDCVAELIYAQRFEANSQYRIAVRTIQFRASAPYVIAD